MSAATGSPIKKYGYIPLLDIENKASTTRRLFIHRSIRPNPASCIHHPMTMTTIASQFSSKAARCLLGPHKWAYFRFNLNKGTESSTQLRRSSDRDLLWDGIIWGKTEDWRTWQKLWSELHRLIMTFITINRPVTSLPVDDCTNHTAAPGSM